MKISYISIDMRIDAAFLNFCRKITTFQTNKTWKVSGGWDFPA